MVLAATKTYQFIDSVRLGSFSRRQGRRRQDDRGRGDWLSAGDGGPRDTRCLHRPRALAGRCRRDRGRRRPDGIRSGLWGVEVDPQTGIDRYRSLFEVLASEFSDAGIRMDEEEVADRSRPA